MIEINSHSCIDSSPSLARVLSLLCTPHGSCATPLRRFFVPVPASTPPRGRRQARSSRVSAGNAPRPFSCSRLFDRSSSRLSIFISSPGTAPAHPIDSLSLLHLAKLKVGPFLHSSLPLPLSPLPSFPPAFLPQGRVCVNANDAFVAQVSDPEECPRIVNAICARGEEMMHRNWAVQCWLEAATGSEERRKIVAVDHATYCYGYYVLQKALDCEEDEITELSWTSPAPQIFAYGNKSLNGK
ncbi:hypothetical protein B0H13DRAFT_2337844 [Mycena leptocephala]|nr:hypothetical protein B0H13DRAFT_2337844 [Mycena leptocephala]